MLRLQRYLLGELLAAFALILTIATGVFLIGSVLQLMQKFPQTSVLALLEALPLFIGLVLPITVPLSFLLACLLSYGRVADDNEYLAMKMGAVSPRHVIAPAVCASAIVSVFTVVLACDINPTLTSAKKAVLQVQVADQLRRMRSTEGEGDIRLGDLEMSWNGRRGDWYLDVALTWTNSTTGSDGQKTVTTSHATAKAATVHLTDESPPRIAVKLTDGRLPAGTGDSLTLYEAKTSEVLIDIEDYNSSGKSKDEMRSADLYYRMVRLEPMLAARRDSKQGDAYRLFACEYWRRAALGLSPIAFALLGVPIGLLTRRGSRAQALIVALVVALPVYYPLLLVGDNFARRDVLPAAVALNLANILLSALGVGLIARLVTR